MYQKSLFSCHLLSQLDDETQFNNGCCMLMLCRRDFVSTLGRVASDVSLWRNVKATASRPSDLSKIRAFLGPHTTSLHILGPVTHKPIKRLNRCAALPKGSVTWITEAFCQTLKLRCTRLKRLTLSNCFAQRERGGETRRS